MFTEASVPGRYWLTLLDHDENASRQAPARSSLDALAAPDLSTSASQHPIARGPP